MLSSTLRRRLGLTLLELIVVIVILGILSAIAVPTFEKLIRTSENHTAIISLENMSEEAWTYARATGNTSFTNSSVDAAAKDVTATALGAGPLAAGAHSAFSIAPPTGTKPGVSTASLPSLHFPVQRRA